MIIPIIVLAAVGILVNLYDIYIERQVKRDPSYRALCDVTETISCTKSCDSRWERVMFGIPNSIISIGYNTLVIALAAFDMAQFIFYVALATALFGAFVIIILLKTEKVLCSTCTFKLILIILQAYVAYQYL